MAMRDGLDVLADLVDRIEAGGVAVEDASLARGDGDGYDVTLALNIAADAEPVGPTRGAAEREAPAEGETAATSQPAGDETTSTSPSAGSGQDTAAGAGPELGALSVAVGRSLGDGFRARQSDGFAGGRPSTPDTDAGSSSPDEPVACRVDGCEETFETEHGMKIHATKAHRDADGSGPSPHRDPDRLREVYDACDTFDEMTEALGVDVTAQTVRRSMMSLGVHDPDAEASGDGASDDDSGTDSPDEATEDVGEPSAEGAPADGEREAAADPESETTPDEAPASTVAEPDLDVLVPDGVDPEVLVTAVREASTLFQVQRAMGLEREEVQALLAELGLLELVTGRVATEDDRDVDREEVRRRIAAQVDDRASVDEDGAPVDEDGVPRDEDGSQGGAPDPAAEAD